MSAVYQRAFVKPKSEPQSISVDLSHSFQVSKPFLKLALVPPPGIHPPGWPPGPRRLADRRRGPAQLRPSVFRNLQRVMVTGLFNSPSGTPTPISTRLRAPPCDTPHPLTIPQQSLGPQLFQELRRGQGTTSGTPTPSKSSSRYRRSIPLPRKVDIFLVTLLYPLLPLILTGKMKVFVSPPPSRKVPQGHQNPPIPVG